MSSESPAGLCGLQGAALCKVITRCADYGPVRRNISENRFAVVIFARGSSIGQKELRGPG